MTRMPEIPPTGWKPGAIGAKPAFAGLVQLAAPFYGDGGILGIVRGVTPE
ncbi:MAG: hypothetical protein QNJ51_02440 [Calothrix sp. MO_167.B12]|nr:hypothetical protein [Calothrix sp. MO_167.B12]